MYIFIHVYIYIYICMLWWICIYIYIDRWIFIYTSSILGIPTWSLLLLPGMWRFQLYLFTPFRQVCWRMKAGEEEKPSPELSKGTKTFTNSFTMFWHHETIYGSCLWLIQYCWLSMVFTVVWSLKMFEVFTFNPLLARVGKPIGLTGFLLPVDELPSLGNYTHSEAWIQWNLVE